MILDKRRRRGAALGLAAVLAATASPLVACTAARDAGASQDSTGKLVVACTFSTLCSLVAAVGGDDVEVVGIVPVGASPETYEPTPSDVVALNHAAVLFENGLGLEAWLEKLLASANSGRVAPVVLSDAVPAREKATGNPHLWMDPQYAALYVHAIAAALARSDPAHAQDYAANERAERSRLAALDRWIKAQVARIPADHRTMITFHDAWFYFDRRYGIDDVGAIEPSPGKDPSPAYFAQLIALARKHHVRAVFGEPQYSPKLAAALQSGAGIKTFADLYDDTIGIGKGLSTYEDIMRYDTRIIVGALQS